MNRVTDELRSLRGCLQERITDDFDTVLARRRSLRRRQVAAGGLVALMCVVAGGGLLAAHERSAPPARLTAVGPSTGSTLRYRTLVTNPYPPCGAPHARVLPLDAAQHQLGNSLLLPSDPNANASNVDKVALCPGGDVIVVFKTGVLLDLMPRLGPTPDWKQHAADDPNESEFGTVNGIPAWIIRPDAKAGANGSVNFDLADYQIIVEGNGTLTADQLVAIASSLPTGG